MTMVLQLWSKEVRPSRPIYQPPNSPFLALLVVQTLSLYPPSSRSSPVPLVSLPAKGRLEVHTAISRLLPRPHRGHNSGVTTSGWNSSWLPCGLRCWGVYRAGGRISPDGQSFSYRRETLGARGDQNGWGRAVERKRMFYWSGWDGGGWCVW